MVITSCTDLVSPRHSDPTLRSPRKGHGRSLPSTSVIFIGPIFSVQRGARHRVDP
jgi:hypothetical protein